MRIYFKNGIQNKWQKFNNFYNFFFEIRKFLAK